MTIDFHSHWLPPELVTALQNRKVPPFIRMADPKAELCMPVGVLPFSDTFSNLESRIEFMDTHGIKTQILSLPCLFGLDSLPANQAVTLTRLFNQATAQAVKSHPKRFAGLAALPFDDIKLAAQEYRHARRELGLLGAIIPIDYFVSIKGMAALQPLFDVANLEGGHLFLHPGRRPGQAGIAGTDLYPDSIMARRQLDIQHQVANAMVTLLWSGFAQKNPGFTLHVANLGGTLPLVIERMDYTNILRTKEPVLPSARVKNAGIMVDCSSMGPIAITTAVKCFGAKNILFGSDHPIYQSDRSLAAIEKADITQAERTAILQDNGARLLAKWR